MEDTRFDDAGNQYEELTLLLSQLNSDAPKILKLYSDFKKSSDLQNQHIDSATKKLDELSRSTLKAIQEDRESAIELFKQYSAAAEESLKEAKDFKTQLEAFSQLAESTHNEMQAVTKRISLAESKLSAIERTLDLLKRNRGEQKVESASKTSVSKKPSDTISVEVDYDEVTTAKALYDKYFGKIDGPLIVEKTKWRNDFVFVIDSLSKDERMVKGAVYINGQFDKNSAYPTNTPEFRVYNGRSANKIRSIHNNPHPEDDLPY